MKKGEKRFGTIWQQCRALEMWFNGYSEKQMARALRVGVVEMRLILGNVKARTGLNGTGLGTAKTIPQLARQFKLTNHE